MLKTRSDRTPAEQTVIDRATRKILRECHLDEPDAYRLLRHRAMQRQMRVVEMAAAVLRMDSREVKQWRGNW